MNLAQHLFPTRHHDTKQNKTVNHPSIGESESLLPLQPSFTTSAVQCSIGFTIGFNNHGEGPY